MDKLKTLELNKKRIIMVHGLASKPPKKDLHELWVRALSENIRLEDSRLGKLLDKDTEVFKTAYWADATPHHIPDDAAYVRNLCIKVENVITERKKIKSKFHVGPGEAAEAFFKHRGMDLVKLLAGALNVRDDVMKAIFRETRLYDEDQYIADRMRKPLEDELRSAWDEGCEVALLAHSMGSFVAYDVLWRFSHRKTDGFKQYNKKRVKLFATMGSPLGDEAVNGLLFSQQHENKGKRQYPTNIEYWHNYSCLGDVVSHQAEFESNYFKAMHKLNIFPDKKPYRTIDYSGLHNPFEVVSHVGNKHREKRNPHKLFGYLAQPRLATWLIDFLKQDLK